MLCLVKMASRTNLHDDLTSAFIRYREGRYDRTLDRKKPQLILSQYVEIFIITFIFFARNSSPKLTLLSGAYFCSFPFLERIKAEGERILKENDPRNTSRINPHSVFWMVAAIAVFYYTDFYIAVRFDPRIHR